MRRYRFLCYTAGVLRNAFECEFPNLACALCMAEFFISIENDNFYEQVRFFEAYEGKQHQLVYRIERCFEPSENYGL